MTSPPLAPAGSSSYESDTMTVGDGTWDSSRNTFLLPNLVGLNFDTMRYNGMGNRFRQLPGYHSLIRAHGIIAAITFLFLVPASILVARFYYHRRAIRLHIWLQILTLFLTIVIFTLGNIAVGPSRRFSNPHHGTGTAIFVLVLFVFLQGWWIHRKDLRKKQDYEPFGVTLHNWLGWAIALLGLAQIPLGLTLYGSPKVLFILYALAATAWLVAFFLLTRRDKRYNGGGDYGSRYSYNTSSVVDDRRRRKTSRGWLKPVLAGIGIYWLIDKFRKKPKYREDGPMGPEVVGSRRHSASYVDDDKYSYYSDGAARWEDRWLKIAAPIGLAWLVRRYYDRKYGDEVSDLTSNYYRPAPGEIDSRGARGPLPPGAPMPPGPAGPGAATYPGQAIPPNQGAYPGQPLPPTQAVPPGPNPYAAPYAAPLPPQGPPRAAEQPLASEHHPLNRGHSRESSFSTSHPSAAGEVRRSHSLRDGLATFGAVGMAKNYWNRWRDRNQDRRIQNERDSRIRGSRFTGDGGPRTHRPGMSSITSESSIRPAHPTDNQGIPPIPAGTYAAGSTEAAAAAAAVEREREQRRQEALPLGGVPRPVHMPAIPPDPQGILHRESSTSESFSSAEGQQRRHSRRDRDLTSAPVERSGEAAAPPLSPPSASKQKRQERYQSLSPGEDSGVTSPPVSVRVKMHKDGRHVTLSRLPRDEAEARRTQTRQSQSDSVSSLGGDDGGRSKFRRRDDQERQNAEAMRIERENLAAARAQAQTSAEPPVTPSNLPIPPPIPESSGSRPSPAVGSVGSPGTYETDASADYANNRRRRRAERARVKAKSGKTVGFE